MRRRAFERTVQEYLNCGEKPPHDPKECDKKCPK